jgi:hypothetical protein
MKSTTLALALLALTPCALVFAPQVAAAAEPAAACRGYGAMRFVCGPASAEDMVRIDGTPWIIASGLAEGTTPGRLHVIDSVSKTWEVAWPTPDARSAHEKRRFAACATPPDPATFSAHGIAIRRIGKAVDELLVVNHGREAIEYFRLDSHSAKPQPVWIGCVPMPADVSLNSVAPLPDGGFVTTQFYTPSKGGMGAILAGQLTGGVLEWHPGKAVTPIAGTDLIGANGIESAAGGRVLYVAAWGGRQIVRFDRTGPTLKKDVVKVDYAPDNLRWSADRKTLLATGQRFEVGGTAPAGLKMDGWRVMRVEPATLALTPVYSADANQPLQGVSIGLEVDGKLWVGPFRGDRVGVVDLPR